MATLPHHHNKVIYDDITINRTDGLTTSIDVDIKINLKYGLKTSIYFYIKLYK